MKKADAAGDIVVRVFEMRGVPAETPLEFLGRRRRFRSANLLEESLGSGETQVLRLSPYEIGTARMVPLK